MSLPTISHFQSLGVTPTTSFADIKRAYRKLSLKYHPDKTPDKTHHEKFKEINVAFEAIRNHYEKFNTTSEAHLPTGTPSASYSEYQQFSSSTGHSFSSRQYYSRFSHSEHSASNARNAANPSGTDGAFFKAFHKSQEQRRQASQEAAARAKRLKEEMLERLKAEAEAKRREELRKAEARMREVEKMEEERRRMESERRRRVEKEERRLEEELKKQREAQEVDTVQAETATEQNRYTKSPSEILSGESDEEYNPNEHRTSHTSSSVQDKEYQNAKQSRRDMADAAETATEFLRNQYNPDDTERLFRSKKSGKVTNGQEEDYVPSSKRRKNDYSNKNRAKNSKGLDIPIVSENDFTDVEAITISDRSYDSEDDDGIEIIEETGPNMKAKGTSNKSSNQRAATGANNGAHVSTEGKADKEYSPEKLDEYIPFSVKPKAPPRSSTRPDTKINPTLSKRPVPPPTNHIRHHATSPHKRSKISANNDSSAFDMGNLGMNVGDIEEVDFRELEDSLPTSSRRKQPNSNSGNVANSSRTTPAEATRFTDGISRAETLSTPMNKNTVRGHSAARLRTNAERSTRAPLTVLDFHASPKVHNFTSPKPPLLDFDANISRGKWQRYVKSMTNYQKSFLEYKELIVRYQLERTQKDFEHFDSINDLQEQSNLAVYNECLSRDLEVITQYKDALRVFGLNMMFYQQNCQWIRMCKEPDPNWT
ncbi:hypothetical protein CANMA_002194 [Candida margitis]|uniref:uncharacterized protein n=1 Tax=Candida margitis TaxID=1775924 RepID=UPI002227A640|nr:uncharacterized protein CANMA_002194 [Candida margitis]KAI5968758.1 hypothetical protein CANMA_002194 [Candida margitis]